MAKYVDGFVIPIPKKNLPHYIRLARVGLKVFLDHGALEYYESVGNDFTAKWAYPFPKLARTKPGETVLFSWIVYKSKAHRDRVNKRVMKDERMSACMADGKMPFDMKRMAYGGFKIIVAGPRKGKKKA